MTKIGNKKLTGQREYKQQDVRLKLHHIEKYDECEHPNTPVKSRRLPNWIEKTRTNCMQPTRHRL